MFAEHTEEGTKTPPSTPQKDDAVKTNQQRESMEEGFVDPDGNIVVSKKMTRVVTTTRTTYDGDQPVVETKRVLTETAEGQQADGGDGGGGEGGAARSLQQVNNNGVDGHDGGGSGGGQTKMIQTAQTGTTHYSKESHSSSHRSVSHTTTTATAGQPLIRLKVNEQVYDGIIDPQQHIHLIPIHVQQQQPVQQPQQQQPSQ
uniref:Uncharacterized protein n=1 Tax=Plectus sambesii TaxID=2011161 RepID=A0A914WH59_9BILA